MCSHTGLYKKYVNWIKLMLIIRFKTLMSFNRLFRGKHLIHMNLFGTKLELSYNKKYLVETNGYSFKIKLLKIIGILYTN